MKAGMNHRLALLAAFALVLLPASAAITPKHSKTFQKLDNCRYVPRPYNDGDSFMVAVGDDEFMFRLYYVDTPESDTRFPVRIAEQAKYFWITSEQSLQVGKDASKFVANLLSTKAFTVRTRWSSALGSSRKSRYYAIVEVDGKGLAEILVEAGLCRLVGTTVNHPSGLNHADYVSKLKSLEDVAKNSKRGAWALSDPKLATDESEVVEVAEAVVIREGTWLERGICVGIGAGFVGLIWVVVAWRSRVRHSDVSFESQEADAKPD